MKLSQGPCARWVLGAEKPSKMKRKGEMRWGSQACWVFGTLVHVFDPKEENWFKPEKKKKRRKESPDILKQGVQAMTQRPNSACSLFFYGPLARKGLYIFNWLKKLSRWTLLDLYKVYEIQFQCPQIKFYLNIAMPIHSLVSLLSVIIKRRSLSPRRKTNIYYIGLYRKS